MESKEDESMFEILADTVKLNIGGYKYEALKETLTKYESFFSLMINSPISSKTDSDGYIYIEQDGQVFKYILDYLKNGEIVFQTNEERLNFVKKISKENEFYQIPDIEDYVYALNGKSVKEKECKTFNPQQRLLTITAIIISLNGNIYANKKINIVKQVILMT